MRCPGVPLSQAVSVLSDMQAHAHQIAEASLFSPKEYWKVSTLFCALLLGLPEESSPFEAAVGAFRCRDVAMPCLRRRDWQRTPLQEHFVVATAFASRALMRTRLIQPSHHHQH